MNQDQVIRLSKTDILLVYSCSMCKKQGGPNNQERDKRYVMRLTSIQDDEFAESSLSLMCPKQQCF